MEISVPKSDSPAATEPTAPPEAPPEAMGKAIGSGATWMVLASLGGKGLAFVSQIVLGIWLTTDDWAVYGIALALSGFVAVFRDGGVRDVLVQRGKSHYDHLIGPVFWLATWMNIAAAVMIWFVAAGLALLQKFYPSLLSPSYQDHWLPWMLAIIAAAVPLQSPAAVLQVRLRLDLHFAQVSRIAMWSALLRNVALIAGAWWLRNPLAFVIPMILVAIYEGIATYRMTRESPWRLPAKLRLWKELLSVGGWMMLQSAANILFDLASFAVIGLLVPKEVVGNYVFAYTWITQTQTLMGYALQQVLFSALARLKDDIERFKFAVRRAQRVQMLLGAVASLGLAVIMKPLESMIWTGKWADCVPAVMILGVFFPFRVTFGLSTAVMLARGQFKALSLITLAEGVLIVAAAGAAAAMHVTAFGITFGGTVESIAYGAGLALLVGRIAGTWITLRDIDFTLIDVIKGMFPAWLVSLAAAGLALLITQSFHFDTYIHEHIGSIGSRGRLADFFIICVIGGLFCLNMAVLSRFLLKSSVLDCIAVLPHRISILCRRAMLLK